MPVKPFSIFISICLLEEYSNGHPDNDHMMKLFTGILISIIAVYLLASKIDISEFSRLGTVNYFYLLPFILLYSTSTIFYTFRWYLLLGKKATFKDSLFSYQIGSGGNMVLPARGGDFFRIYFIKKKSSLSYPLVMSRLFIEKVIDLVFVVILGLVAFFLLDSGADTTQTIFIFSFSIFTITCILLVLLVVRFKTIILINFLKQIASYLKKENEFHYKLEHHILDIAEFLSFQSFFKPFLITITLWLFFYTGGYLCIAYLLGIEINYLQALFLIFLGAMGVAIPSAPSGIGVFHASIVSGFVIMGKTASQGLVYATILHLSQFILLSTVSLVFYLVWVFSAKNEAIHGSN